MELKTHQDVVMLIKDFGADLARSTIIDHISRSDDPRYLHSLADSLLSASMFDLASLIYVKKNSLHETNWGFLNFARCVFRIGDFNDGTQALRKALLLSSKSDLNTIFTTGCRSMFQSVDSIDSYKLSLSFIRSVILDFNIETPVYQDLGLLASYEKFNARYSTVRERLQQRLDIWYKNRDPRFVNVANLSHKINAIEYVKNLGIPTPKTFYLQRDIGGLDPNILPENYVVKPDNGADSKGVLVNYKGVNLFDEMIVDKYSIDFWDQVSKHVLNAPHTNSKTRILIEEYMDDDLHPGTIPLDYKVHCYGGKASFIQVINRNPGHKGQSFYDRNWNRLPHVINDYPVNNTLGKPINFDTLIEYADTISSSIGYMVRVDFYMANHSVYFGEVTTYPAGGFKFSIYGNALSIQLWELFPDVIDIYKSNLFDSDE